MNWINIEVSSIDSEEFLGAEPVERATWLCLLRFCVGQENGGRIVGAKEWKDRKWQQVVRVTSKEVGGLCDLWSWDGDDLIVTFYPLDKEIEVKTNRLNGGKGGRPKKGSDPKPKEEPKENHPVSNRDNLTETEGFEIVETERNRKERKGIEENTPLPPEGGEEGAKNRILPNNWQRLSSTAQKQTRVNLNSETMVKIGRFLGRKAETLWSVAEAVALKNVSPSADEIELMASYYGAMMEPDKDYRRRDLLTLLNNWNGELDRARIFKSSQS